MRSPKQPAVGILGVSSRFGRKAQGCLEDASMAQGEEDVPKFNIMPGETRERDVLNKG